MAKLSLNFKFPAPGALFFRRIRSLLCGFLAFAVLFSLPAYPVSASRLGEYDVKAAFLYQFTKFVEWPEKEEKKKEFSICVMGVNPFGGVLKELEQEKVGDMPVSVKRNITLQEAGSCQVLFVSAGEEARLEQILEEVRGKDILTVGETEGFLEKGGTINFIKQGSKIRFEINLKDAERKNIKISSKLLGLALNVLSS